MPRPNLAARLRTRLSRMGHGSKNQPLMRWAYTAAVRAEAEMARVVAARHAVPATDPGNLTILIKTFERPRVLQRALASIRRVYAGPIIVADDSAATFVSADPLVKVLPLPFDTGIGAGRNVLIDAAATEYLMMLDDDMILLPSFDVGRALAYLERNPEVHLCGGRVINLPQWSSPDYSTATLFAYRGRPLRPQGTIIDGLPVYYKVNFYMARTAEVRRVRYDDRLKRVDHADFFTSAYGRLLCVYDAGWVGLHAHSMFDAHYQAFRTDHAADLAYLSSKWFAAPVANETEPNAS